MSRTAQILLSIAGVAVLAVVLIGLISTDRALPRVTAERVGRHDIVSRVTANGKIQAEKKVEMSALVMGQIVNLAVRNGERVRKGDFLLQIDRRRAAAEEEGSAAALQASLAARDAGRAALEQAQRDFERARRNYETRILPEAELERARFALDTARANLDVAQRRIEQSRANLNASRDTLSKTNIRAPIDGVVTSLSVKEGEVTVLGTMNVPGTQLLTISDMSRIEAVLMVDETDVPRVVLGQKALLSIEAYPGQNFDGVVTQVENSPIQRNDADLQGLVTTSDAINFKVRVGVLAPPPTIRPGFSVTADILTGARSRVLAVPLAAVVTRDSPAGEKTAAGRLKSESGVYALRAGRSVFVPIRLGIADDLMVEVAEGLSEREQIATGPFRALRTLKPGDRVRIQTDRPPAGNSGDGDR
jgi:HlyD family secretion protein